MATSFELHPETVNSTQPNSNNSDNITQENVGNTTSGNFTSKGIISTLAIVVQVVMFIVIIFGNSLVIHAVRTAKHLQARTNYFIVQLAIADILVAVILPFHIALFLYRDLLNDINICLLRYCTVLATVALSVMSLLSMTYDRLLSLLYPIHYQLKMTKTKFIVLSITSWVVSFVSGFTPMFWHEEIPNFSEKVCDYVVTCKLEYLQFLQVPMFFVAAFTIMGMYTKIFYIAYKNKARNLRRMRQQSNDPNQTSNDLKQKHAFTITKTCAIVMGSFFVCWLPFMLTVTVQVYTDNLHNETLLNLRTIFTFVAMSNSAMNPIIYAARYKTFINILNMRYTRTRY